MSNFIVIEVMMKKIIIAGLLIVNIGQVMAADSLSILASVAAQAESLQTGTACFKYQSREKTDANSHNSVDQVVASGDAQSSRKGYVCDFPGCEKEYSNRGNLNIHKRKHFGVRPFSCNECGKTFDRQNNCNRHTLSHRDERPFKCDICNQPFKRQDHLKNHKKMHREKQTRLLLNSSGELYCTRSFLLKESSNKHSSKNP